MSDTADIAIGSPILTDDHPVVATIKAQITHWSAYRARMLSEAQFAAIRQDELQNLLTVLTTSPTPPA